MPIRVTIELIPNGDESRAEMLEMITITQRHRYDADPEGLRMYEISDNLAGGDLVDYVNHHRSAGAVRLVVSALATIAHRHKVVL